MKKKKKKDVFGYDLEHYITSNHYSIRGGLCIDNKGSCFCYYMPELPGCVSFARNHGDAFDGLGKAKENWISNCMEHGREVPKEHDGDILINGMLPY